MNQQQAPEQHYAGLDVSLDSTAVCVIDAKGAVLWRKLGDGGVSQAAYRGG